MRISVKYLKGILVGAAASVGSVILFSVVSVILMSRFPEVAMRIIAAERHELWMGRVSSHLV